MVQAWAISEQDSFTESVSLQICFGAGVGDQRAARVEDRGGRLWQDALPWVTATNVDVASWHCGDRRDQPWPKRHCVASWHCWSSPGQKRHMASLRGSQPPKLTLPRLRTGGARVRVVPVPGERFFRVGPGRASAASVSKLPSPTNTTTNTTTITTTNTATNTTTNTTVEDYY